LQNRAFPRQHEETWFRANVELSYMGLIVMQFLTEQETHAWLGKTPIIIQREKNDLSFPTPFCFKLELPTKIYRASNFVNFLLPYEQGSLSCRSLLWFTDWGMWNKVHERAGMFMLEQMRSARGEHKSLFERPGQLFGSSEDIALQSFLILPVLFSWDAYLAPESGEYFVFNSHDESVYVVSGTERTHEKLFKDLTIWEPKEAEWNRLARKAAYR
jgi:hypothetical protein